MFCGAHCSGWVVSSTLAGATVGSFTGGTLADKLGRKRTFQLNALPLIVGTLLRSVALSLQGVGSFVGVTTIAVEWELLRVMAGKCLAYILSYQHLLHCFLKLILSTSSLKWDQDFCPLLTCRF
jgi:MFS family permease